MLEKLWDDVVAGPRPETGLDKLRKATASRPLAVNHQDAEGASATSSLTAPATPTTPRTPVTPSANKNVWRSVFNPGSNLATRALGANLFDRPQPNSPTVYDWLYSDETKSNHR